MIERVVSGRIYFDTNIFRDAFEGTDDKAEILKSIFDAARQKPKRIVTSELTLAELLGKDVSEQGWTRQKRFYLALIVFNRFVDLRPVSREILLDTGDYRRAAQLENRRVKLPDAIHVVTAIKAGCQYVFTSDKRFAVPRPLQLIGSDKDGVETILKALNA